MAGEDRLEMKDLILQLAQAINHSIAESEEVQQVIESIREEGFGVEVSVAASIGLFGLQDDPEEAGLALSHPEMKFELDEMDLNFLKSLRLRID